MYIAYTVTYHAGTGRRSASAEKKNRIAMLIAHVVYESSHCDEMDQVEQTALSLITRILQQPEWSLFYAHHCTAHG